MLDIVCLSRVLAYVFFTGELIPLILRDIKDRGLVPVIFAFVGIFMCFCFPSFGFVLRCLTSCLFFSIGSFCVLELSFYDLCRAGLEIRYCLNLVLS